MKRTDPNYIKNTFLLAKAGDADAVGTLFALSCDQVYSYAFSYVQDRYAACDVLVRTYEASIREGRANTYSALLLQKAFDFSFLSMREWAAKIHPELDDLELDDHLNRMVKSGRARYMAFCKRGRLSSPKTSPEIPALSGVDKSLLLDEILDLLGIPVARFSLPLLEANARKSTPSFGFQKFLLTFGIIACLVLPVFMVGPRIRIVREEVSISDSSQATRPQFHITTGFFPVRNVSASLNGKPEKIYSESDGSYALLPASNGTLVFTASLWNGQQAAETVELNDVDLAAPILKSYKVTDGMVHLYVTDSGSGIDYASIYGEKQNKETIRPVSSFKETGEIVFKAPPHQLIVYVSDRNKNLLKVKIMTD